MVRSTLSPQPSFSLQYPNGHSNRCRIHPKGVGHAPSVGAGISLDIQQHTGLGVCHTNGRQFLSVLTQDPQADCPHGPRRPSLAANPNMAHVGMLPEVQPSDH